MWAHYADRQKGLCLGFDIPDPDANIESEVMRVQYEPTPLPFPSDLDPDRPHLKFSRSVLSTKFEDWAYEEEIRIWGLLQNEDRGRYFANFGKDLELAEVIVGARSTLTKDAIVSALGLVEPAAIIKAREDYSSFRMVEDEAFR